MNESNTQETIETLHERRLQDDEAVEQQMHLMSRRSFLWAGVAVAAGFAGWKWLNAQPLEDGIVWPFRRAFGLNERLTRAYFSDAHLVPTYPRSMAETPRPNGGYGLTSPIDSATWRLMVIGLEDTSRAIRMTMPSPTAPHPRPQDMLAPPEDKKGASAPPPRTQSPSQEPAVPFTLDEIKSLERVEMVTEFKCIEGWSTIVHWAGARFADFVAKYPPKKIDGKLPQYVGMETPDGGYYVGLDMESALHPQTLLCYEMNGEPLPPEHGAPLRLVIPVKYGIKNIKRIGAIRFTNERPEDYWAKVGYDWYAGH